MYFVAIRILIKHCYFYKINTNIYSHTKDKINKGCINNIEKY